MDPICKVICYFKKNLFDKTDFLKEQENSRYASKRLFCPPLLLIHGFLLCLVSVSLNVSSDNLSPSYSQGLIFFLIIV